MNMLCYTAKGNKVADEIKVANKLTLRWQDDPGLAGWTQPNHRSPYKWKSEAEWGTLGYVEIGRAHV